MNESQVIENKIRKKEAEIRSLEEKLRSARIYVQALTDVRRELDGDGSELKAGSMVALARDVIRKSGAPMHVDDIIKAIGRTLDSKSSLTGSLAAYVRRGEIFTRPAPNTYGLVEADDDVSDLPVPPTGFGGAEAYDTDLDDDVPF